MQVTTTQVCLLNLELLQVQASTLFHRSALNAWDCIMSAPWESMSPNEKSGDNTNFKFAIYTLM